MKQQLTVTPMIGRDREMRRLAELLGRMAPGRPVVLVVDGPAASGRSRLLREFAAAGRRRGTAVVADVPGPRPRRVVIMRDHPATADLDRLDQIAAVTGVLVITTEHRATAPVFATTPAEVHRMRLEPLSAGEVQRLLAAALGARAGDPLLDLARVAAGRPGAVLDLVAGLREEGLLRIDAGLVVPAGARLPERTRARLADQLASLSPSARHLVQAATVLRSPFPLIRLGRVLQCGLITLVPDVEEALDSGLFVAAGNALSFSHDLVRPIVEASMPRAVVAALREEHARAQPATARQRPTARAAAEPGPADWTLLSEREMEIAELVGQALTNQQIAGRLDRSPHTVNFHLRQIFRKLGIASRVELVSLLRRRAAPTR
jgi:DNA-binding CsgD family transcriptional regulator